MKKENLDYCRDLVEKINGINSLIEDIKKSNKWGFKTREIKLFTEQTERTTGYGYSVFDPEWSPRPKLQTKVSTYTIDNENALKKDILEVLEKHKKLMEEALEEL